MSSKTEDTITRADSQSDSNTGQVAGNSGASQPSGDGDITKSIDDFEKRLDSISQRLDDIAARDAAQSDNKNGNNESTKSDEIESKLQQLQSMIDGMQSVAVMNHALSIAQSMGFQDPRDVISYIDLAKYSVGDMGDFPGLRDAVEKIAKEKQYLLKPKHISPTGNATNPGSQKRPETKNERLTRIGIA